MGDERPTCPVCGADYFRTLDGDFIEWECDSTQIINGEFTQSKNCRIGQLKARVVLLEGLLRQIRHELIALDVDVLIPEIDAALSQTDKEREA